MKKLLSMIVTTGLLATGLYVFAIDQNTGNIACTMEYAPVCAKVQVQCIKAPCYPVMETFSNKCMMGANPSATFAYSGECKEDTGTSVDNPTVSKEFQDRVSSVLGKYMSNKDIKAKLNDAVAQLLLKSNYMDSVKRAKLMYIKEFLDKN